ncbi:hypothetical protein BpHYR1_044934 [Brachionus plicatilis]|uniref:Uncharacterized protein n=1 Tax=Brachionus plicatilis TaxID=10195 RepID=A0A3M7S082_BRAPC|nr:hypothetical protein BpHYR1_044934 [Brachionus plicatilis]
MPREYVESVNYEYNKVDGQTYINVNVVRPVEKIKAETESHHSSKLSRAKSTLKSSTGKSQKSQHQVQSLEEQQLQEQQTLEQQQQLQYEQQQQEQQEYDEQQDQEQQEYQEQQEEGEYNEEDQEYEQGDQEEANDDEEDIFPNGKSCNEELLRIQLRRLELKELEMRRSEIRDLEQRRNELLKSITLLGCRRRNSSVPIRTLSSESSRLSSEASVYRSQASEPQEHVTKATSQRSVPIATARPQAPSNYQNGSGVGQQRSARTIAQIAPETRNRTVREVSNTVYEPESQTEFERKLNLPSQSYWANAVQDQTNKVWNNGGGLQATPGAYQGQQFYPNYAQNQNNNQQFPAQQSLTQKFVQPEIQQVPNQFTTQQSFGQQFGTNQVTFPQVPQAPQVPDQFYGQQKTIAQPYAPNQNYSQDMNQLNQPNFSNQYQQAPNVAQMESSMNFQLPQQNYYQ